MKCQYCGKELENNDAATRHASECPVMNDEPKKICPYCNGTALDLYGDTGGSCPHCFGGYTR